MKFMVKLKVAIRAFFCKNKLVVEQNTLRGARENLRNLLIMNNTGLI